MIHVTEGGSVGKALSEEQAECWTLSHRLCNTLGLMVSDTHGEKGDNSEQDTNTGRRAREENRWTLIAEKQLLQK